MSILILAVLLILGCSSNYSNSQSDNKPLWIKNRPHSSEYYIGIGIAAYTGNNEEDIRRATENARNDLAASLRVQIESTTENIVTEGGEFSTDIMNYHVKSSVDMVLEDVEIVDVWSGNAKKEGYWVYARLSKRLLAEKARIKKENAKNLAISNYQSGNESLSNGLIGSALSSFIEGYANIIEYINEPIELNDNGNIIVLNSGLKQSIEAILSKLKLSNMGVAVVKGNFLKPLSAPLKVKIEYDDSDQEYSASGIPIAYYPVDISMDLQESGLTNRDNIAQSTVFKLTDEKDIQYVDAKIDMAKLVRGLTNEKELEIIVLNSFSNLPLSSTTFKIEVANILVADSYEFDGNVPKEALNIIRESVRDGLTKNLGIAFTEKSAGSNFDLVVSGISESLPANEFGIYFSYISYTFTLRDNQKNEIIYSKVLNRVKGAGLNKSLSLNKAIMNGATKFKKELLKEIITVIEDL